MKSILNIVCIPFLVVVFFTSCNDDKVHQLENKIEVLQKQVTILKDFLKINLEQKLNNTMLIGQPLHKEPKVNEKTKIRFAFSEQWTLPKYDVYEVVKKNNEVEKKLLLKQQISSHFDITFHPKTKQDTLMKLEVVFMINNRPLMIPALVVFDLD
ncbi:MAG: hypothetical protein AB8B65_14755 [Kordia sp.]|uniref:hypothetical protein n=1 Tax=Kordia sp. TaxID=1965332 RepID=UPI00385CA499